LGALVEAAASVVGDIESLRGAAFSIKPMGEDGICDILWSEKARARGELADLLMQGRIELLRVRDLDHKVAQHPRLLSSKQTRSRDPSGLK